MSARLVTAETLRKALDLYAEQDKHVFTYRHGQHYGVDGEMDLAELAEILNSILATPQHGQDND